MAIGSIYFVLIAAFWVFILYVLWTIARSLRSIAESLQELSRRE